jgi:bacillolysin
MKNQYKSWALVLSLCFLSQIVSAQQGFDRKKREPVEVNTTGLSARKIPVPRENSATRVGRDAFGMSREFVRRDPRHKVLHAENSLPRFIETLRESDPSQVLLRTDPPNAAYDYLEELTPTLKMSNMKENFIVNEISHEQGFGSHVRMQQHYREVPVYGAEISVHLNENLQGVGFNGRYVMIDKDMNVVPAIAVSSAVERVRMDISRGSAARPLTFLERKYVQHAEPSAKLCLYEDRSLVTSVVLAYHIIYSPSIHQRWEYFVDAQNGNVIRQFNSVCLVDGPKTATANDLNGTSRTVNTYQKGSAFFMLDASRAMFNATASSLPDEPVGGILTIDMSNTFGDNAAFGHVTNATNVWGTANNAKAVSAHFNAGEAYKYFLLNHDRSSINGTGGSIISIINVSNPEDGTAMDNAFWNGQAMFYGNGATGFKPLAGAMDVAGHEMTHGVVENTAKLEYNGESGAINESMADIFGAMMDPDDWTIGEDVVKAAAFPSGALRSLSDPHNGGSSLGDAGFQPKHMNEKYTGTQDNGGVHINSGIPNHAFFKYAESMSSRIKAADVFYRALDLYLTKSSQFIDLRLAVIKSAEDLFGASSDEAVKAAAAFDAVGIVAGQGGDYTNNLPVNPGSEFLLLYSTDPEDANSLYRVTADLASATPLTTTIFKSRPSVTDDGELAVFVAADKTIHAIVTKPGETPEEFIVQDEAIWSNVAVSKGGNRLAAVTESWDNTIYVYDFGSESWGEFELYNPTYSDVNSGGTVYADALEWDYSGEYVVYDAFNEIENSNGQNIEYWDVNFMRVWNIAANDFADGTVSKLFSSLPEGVSIGNPSFAKVSPFVLAFDMIDELNGTYAILGSNIESGETDIIFNNETLGYPSFNKNDSRVAFTLDDGAGGYATGFVNLNSNKISSPAATATGIFSLTMWPVYFAAGSRDIGDEVTANAAETKTVNLTCYPNPFEDELKIDLATAGAVTENMEVTNLLGQKFPAYVVKNDDNTISLSLGNLPSGNYIVSVRNGHKKGMCRLLKTR